MKKNRIKWIDVAKFFGIFLIYLGHFSNIGRYRSVIFLFHVPLFFFLSGCNENFDKENNLFKYVYKCFKRILIPFIIFALFSIVLYVLMYNPNASDLKETIFNFLNGCIRNKFIAHGLWFLSCLFIMKIVFKLIKYTNNKIIMFLICIGLFIIANIFKFNKPSLFFNVDSAIYFMIYYCIGYVSFDYLKDFFTLDSKKKKFWFLLSGMLCLSYALILFLRKDLIISLPLTTFFGVSIRFIKTLIMIYCVLFISKLCEEVNIFSKIGQNTLYLCGNEYFVKRLLPLTLSIFGVKIYTNGIVSTIIYSLILIVVSFILSIYEKKLVEKIKQKLRIKKEKV